ncbi:histone H2B [Marchantia polymorpha subsp. ruderalis]|uniref:Core Histone H2A/H2B/H3 domain-containing protein n=2 Tax=Marchantia polymorpha TaxID=3197 RepID=A0AAF6AUX8_MARPO|nr:hypothetical protein MARPO_0002s0112 [Marchantia polymorpha]PTQ49635.1 hypothetical protein MARPO_0002s0112 [Marchantia polymorpha]BBN00249.1 hypothetical protein Mp_1g27660 [Marchantia polymorpha subsp. ruderalis]|eukprot:PTQ49634.1 hypothetical protein MARPO_0002s0112 [Marchantia polymorpha]
MKVKSESSVDQKKPVTTAATKIAISDDDEDDDDTKVVELEEKTKKQSRPKKSMKNLVLKSKGKSKRKSDNSTQSTANTDGVKKRRKPKKSVESYRIYIYKVLKQVHPEFGISSKAMSIMNSFLNDIFERLASEAVRLSRYSKKPTVASREIQTAVRLTFPGELAKHAIAEGTKAVGKFTTLIKSS